MKRLKIPKTREERDKQEQEMESEGEMEWLMEMDYWKRLNRTATPDEIKNKREEIRKMKVPSGVKEQMMEEYKAGLPNGETVRNYMKRIMGEMKKTPLEFTKTETMKERKYENTLHWILGKLEGQNGLDSEDISQIVSKIQDVLKEEETDKKIIKG